jgi:hypothetical protein
MNKKDCVDEATCSLRNVLLAMRDSTANIQEIRTLADSLASSQKEPAHPYSGRLGQFPSGSNPALAIAFLACGLRIA